MSIDVFQARELHLKFSCVTYGLLDLCDWTLSVFKKSFPVSGATLLGILLRMALVYARRLRGEIAILHQSRQEISSLFM
jgi:hypothetical protein